jgi:hypothetical protein
MLRCSERSPSTERLKLWKEIDSRLPELEHAAAVAIEAPPMVSLRQGFMREELSLDEVVINADGTFTFSFNSPTGDRIDMWPMVTFQGWAVKESEWVP